MMKKSILFMTMMLVAAFAMPAFGQASAIDYYGFAWEDGGFPPSNPGDVLIFTGVGNAADPVFDVDLMTEELTFYMYDLVSTGQIPIGGDVQMVNYAGGYLEIYRDAGMNADWGIAPPNPTSPSTFVDGSLFFRGSFNAMTMFLNTVSGDGSYEGTLDGLSGTMIDDVCTGCVYTWGGNFFGPSGAQIPDGYDIQIDGVFEIEEAVATEDASWGSVKALFN